MSACRAGLKKEAAMNIEALRLVIDINRDGAYSPWEIWQAVKWVYRLPGNLLVEGLGHVPYLSTALNIQASEATGYHRLNGSLSVSISLIFWVAVIFIVLHLLSPTEDVPDEAHDNTTALAGHGMQPLGIPTHTQRHGHEKLASGRHAHLPVSRPNYAAPGTKPKRRRRPQQLVNYLISHAK